MKNLRMLLACLAIGSATALGCDVEPPPEPDTTPQTPMAANQGQDSVQPGPRSAIDVYQRDKKIIPLAEVGDLAAHDKVKDSLRACIDKDLNLTECLRLLDIANRPRPVCPTCEATPAARESLLVGERIDRR